MPHIIVPTAKNTLLHSNNLRFRQVVVVVGVDLDVLVMRVQALEMMALLIEGMIRLTRHTLFLPPKFSGIATFPS